MSITVMILIGAGVFLLPIIFYIVTKFNKTENELIKLLGLCESIYDLKDITGVSNHQHFIENLFMRDPLKLYPERVQEKYRQKYY